jgi:ring-1,2-phenylacetyl-CoA epoxidase subunit PaaC
MSPTSDNPYDLLSSVHDDDRWAFGTGFTDPLSGVDTSVPAEVDAAELAALCLALGDDALIYSHRLQEWVTRMPELEEETAIANIALDLLGQARLLLSRAGSVLGQTEDQLAFFRVEKEFRNVRLAEHADADFAELVGRLLIFATWRLSVFSSLTASPDPVLAAIAAKGVHELSYHRDYAAEWVVRLGDGTPYSRERMERALAVLWPLTGELSDADWRGSCEVVLSAAGLARPDDPAATGRDGVHTEAMGYILAELQSVARTYPDATW